ncbi:hypothetical protein NNJEOMEG_01618 [Fundidesulfovibrio magnetotacticus]|uniref:Uncharacterized protein n=1 Tax=Fundidesulfovibrio magnetotacticus TaxID=2730080 RepID=A0A6V8LPY3_9BACT|nr:hypothetical protein [Fundidesulfovibrio magnetotacticus]GFK93784.1 hypothetical protein NNJEOMEG_01618 [Fundidesulfovibrio magnetotacticus]
MNGEKDFHRLDLLMEQAFRNHPEASATPGFEARVMARLAEARRSLSFWDILPGVARPLLASGFAAALLLGALAFSGMGRAGELALAATYSGDAVTRWLAL